MEGYWGTDTEFSLQTRPVVKFSISRELFQERRGRGRGKKKGGGIIFKGNHITGVTFLKGIVCGDFLSCRTTHPDVQTVRSQVKILSLTPQIGF